MPTNHFSFVGTPFKTGWDSKGDRVPLAVVSKGGGAALAGGTQRRAAPLSGRKNPKKPAVSWHTTLPAKSSVLYLWRPWVAEGVVRGRNKRFQSATEQADFASLRARNRGFAFSKIRLFGCRGCGFVPRRSEAEAWNGAASPGEQKVYHPPSRRSDVPRHPKSNGTVACSGSLSLKHRNKYRIASYA